MHIADAELGGLAEASSKQSTRAGRQEEAGPSSQMQELRDGSGEMCKVEGGRGETTFPFSVLDIAQHSRFSYIKPQFHCHIRGYIEVNYFFSKLMQKVLKTVGVTHEKILSCLTPNRTGHIQF